jgi:polyisoprenoid-binding protein YceI
MIWGAVLGGAAMAGWFDTTASAEKQTPVSLAAGGGNWQVQDGTLKITVTQMGSDVTGAFSDWSAQIQYSDEADENGKHGEVSVEIATGSLSLGSVTNQATGPGYLASEAHPVAEFSADLMRQNNGLIAVGDLVIREQSVPVEMPFTLTIEGNTAQASGGLQVDRRDFNMGTDVTDEGSLAFSVGISFELSATRGEP